MHALAHLGDTAGVRNQFQRLRHALDELGEEPSDETVELATRLQHDQTMHRPNLTTSTTAGAGQSASE
jgi:hypothetical protein